MSDLPVNVNVDEDGRQRILRDEETWDGKKLVVLTLVTLAIVVASLYAMANAWYWMHKI